MCIRDRDDVPAEPPGASAPHRQLSEVPLSQCLGWTRALRGAVLRHASHEKAYLGGHAPSGERLREPHPAFIPLGFVGTPFADGRCRAVAVVPPSDIASDRRTALDPDSYTPLRAHETVLALVCLLLLEKKTNSTTNIHHTY